MPDHELTKLKNDYSESHGLSDQPMDVVMTCTLGGKTLQRIGESDEGSVVKFCDMVDNYDAVKEDLENFLKFNYIPHEQDYDLKFVLKSLKISDIQSPDNNNNLVIGGSLAMPNIHALSFPTDHINGGFKKVFDLNGTRNYVLGRPHSFVHALKHSGVNNSYDLVRDDSVVNPKVLFPGDTTVKSTGDPLLYSWKVNDDSFYKNAEHPQVVEYLRPSGPDSLRTDYRVNIPDSCFLRSWHKNKPDYDTEDGCDIPLDLHAKSVYSFLDTLNHNRVTTLDRSGIWWDVQQLREAPIKFNLGMTIHPVVPNVENKQSIPYHNLKRNLRTMLPKTKNAF